MNAAPSNGCPCPLHPATAPASVTPASVTPASVSAAAQPQEDGGWTVGFTPHSPAAVLEWRGYATVGAIGVLRDNGRWPD